MEGEVCHAESEEVPGGVVGARRRGWCSSRAVRSRTSLLIWGCRRRRCGSTCGRSRRTRVGGRICRRSEEREEIRKLRREVFELRRANEILKAALGVFRGRARSAPSEVSVFIDEQRGRFGVEPICRALGVSASAYYQRASGERSARRVEDERLLELIRRDPRSATTSPTAPGGCGRRSGGPASRSAAAGSSG